MTAGIWLRIFMIAVGLAILGVTTVSLAKRHMTESFCVFWGFIAILCIIAGVTLRPTDWNRYISWSALVIIMFGVICVLTAGFFFSLRISRLIRQVTELSIHVSLLNQENELMLTELSKQNDDFVCADSEKQEHEEENLIYN